MMILKVILASVLLIGIGVAGIAVKMFLVKGGKFTKSCSSVESLTGKKVGCVCGNGEGTECTNRDKKHEVAGNF